MHFCPNRGGRGSWVGWEEARFSRMNCPDPLLIAFLFVGQLRAAACGFRVKVSRGETGEGIFTSPWKRARRNNGLNNLDIACCLLGETDTLTACWLLAGWKEIL